MVGHENTRIYTRERVVRSTGRLYSVERTATASRLRVVPVVQAGCEDGLEWAAAHRLGSKNLWCQRACVVWREGDQFPVSGNEFVAEGLELWHGIWWRDPGVGARGARGETMPLAISLRVAGVSSVAVEARLEPSEAHLPGLFWAPKQSGRGELVVFLLWGEQQARMGVGVVAGRSAGGCAALRIVVATAGN